MREWLAKLSIKKRQYLSLAVIITIVGSVVLFWLYIINNKGSNPKQIQSASKSRVVGQYRLNEQGHFKQMMSSGLKHVEGKVLSFEGRINNGLENLSREIKNIRRNMPEREQVSDISQRVDALESRYIDSKGQQVSASADQENDFAQIEIHLTAKKKEGNSFSVHDSVAAGTIGKGVLVSGVDAPTNTASLVDPRPVLIRLVDDGILPNRLKGRLKDCHILADSYGDISSGRAMMRIEKLSCTDMLTYDIIDTDVSGYVTGEDGRVGLAGEIKETAGKHLAYGAVSGILGGLSEASVPDSDTSVTAFGAFTNKSTSTDRFKKGVFTGGNSSMERLSEYWLDRAEKLEPVIQVAAGRLVDVIFKKTVRIGSKAAIKAAKTQKEESDFYKLGEVRHD